MDQICLLWTCLPHTDSTELSTKHTNHSHLNLSASGHLHNNLLVTTLRLCRRLGSYSCLHLTGFKIRFFILQPPSSKTAIPVLLKKDNCPPTSAHGARNPSNTKRTSSCSHWKPEIHLEHSPNYGEAQIWFFIFGNV